MDILKIALADDSREKILSVDDGRRLILLTMMMTWHEPLAMTHYQAAAY